MKTKILVFGGAGFIGSHIARKFSLKGHAVTVIDGLLPRTGGRIGNLNDQKNILLIQNRIEECQDLSVHIQEHDVIIDCMAWTSHLGALKDPDYDLQLNLLSHLHLISQFFAVDYSDKKIIYLASRGQYGNVDGTMISEDTPMIPNDIQGVHKLAAESYYRIYSKQKKLNVISLRFPNCFGENQNCFGVDIGLVGGFIKDLLQDKKVQIFGKERVRSLVYAGDIAEIVRQLSELQFSGFHALNVGGKQLEIAEIATLLKDIIKKGDLCFEPMPEHLKNIDMGNVSISEENLQAWIGAIPSTDLNQSFSDTVKYFQLTMS
jgi:UDP-glucose 4-epimerase